MALLSQALHLGYLLSPHSAFQGHAAHTARWPAMLSPNGSSDTCISAGVFHIPMPCFHGALPVYPKVVITFLHNASRRTRRAMHASCESPWHSLAKQPPLGGLLPPQGCLSGACCSHCEVARNAELQGLIGYLYIRWCFPHSYAVLARRTYW